MLSIKIDLLLFFKCVLFLRDLFTWYQECQELGTDMPTIYLAGKIGTPDNALAILTPNPIAANVPQTLAKKTTTPILAFLPNPLFL